MTIEKVVDKNDNEDRINRYERAILKSMSPADFDSSNSNNHPLVLERNFQHACAFLEMQGVSAPEDLTVYQFYSKYYFHLERVERGKANSIQTDS